MVRSYFLLALVCTSLGAGNAKCAPGDASCPGDEEVLLQSVMIHEVDQQKQLLDQGEEEDAEDDEEDAGPRGLCSQAVTPNSCMASSSCVWWDGKCQQACSNFETEGGCPSRCKWDGVRSRCSSSVSGAAKTSGVRQGSASKAVITGKVSKFVEKMGGPGSDLIFALPLVISNVTKVSTRITVSQGSKGMETGSHKFGNPNADKALLTEVVSGFWRALLADPHANRAGVQDKCPAGDYTVIKGCIELALCLVQDHLQRTPKARKRYMKIYAMLETLQAQFSDIAWPQITASLKHEQAVFFEGYTGPYVPSLNASFVEASKLACPTAKTSKSNNKNDDNDDQSLSQEDSEHTAVRAAAYHASAALIAAARATHAILDAHTHNSSLEATVEALEESWKPPCELLNCDHKNYYDLWGASHSHSLALIEAGASAQHMREHIRTRHRLEVRMQVFAGEHPEFGAKVLARDGTKAMAKFNHYTATLRPHLHSFAQRYAATKTDDELMDFIGSQGMKELEENQAEDGTTFNDGIKPETETVNAAMQEWEDGNDDSEQELSQLEEESEEEEEVDNRGGKGSRRRSFSRAMRRVGKGIARAARAVVRFIASVFNCVGMPAKMSVAGYVQKQPVLMTVTGGGIQFGIDYGLNTKLYHLLQGKCPAKIGFFVGVVVGSIPLTQETGGARWGVAVSGKIGCAQWTCGAGISVATAAAAAYPLPAAHPVCVGGKEIILGPVPTFKFKCQKSMGYAMTIYCCKYDFFTKKTSC